MGDVINLNKFRKQRNRKEAEETAKNNRARFGRSGLQKMQDKDQRQRDKATLDQKKLTSKEVEENDSPTKN